MPDRKPVWGSRVSVPWGMTNANSAGVEVHLDGAGDEERGEVASGCAQAASEQVPGLGRDL